MRLPLRPAFSGRHSGQGADQIMQPPNPRHRQNRPTRAGYLGSTQIGVLHRNPRRAPIGERDYQPRAASPAITRHHTHPLTSQRMPGVDDLYFRWKPVGVVLQCVTDFKNEAGLDHYQVRSWRAWYAHITLSMLALAWLAATRAQAAKGEPPPGA